MTRQEVQRRRKELSNELPALAARVFAVRFGRAPLMKTLGAVMRSLNDYDSPYDHTNLAMDEVLIEELVELVTICERPVVSV